MAKKNQNENCEIGFVAFLALALNIVSLSLANT